MLLHHWKPDTHDDTYFNKASSIKETNPSTKGITKKLLFLHLWSGCDTILLIFGKEKESFLTSLQRSKTQRENSPNISNVWSSQNEIIETSIAAFKICYGGNEDSMLSILRYALLYRDYIIMVTLLKYCLILDILHVILIFVQF